MARERDLRFQAEAELTIEREAAAKGREQVMLMTPFSPTLFLKCAHQLVDFADNFPCWPGFGRKIRSRETPLDSWLIFENVTSRLWPSEVSLQRRGGAGASAPAVVVVVVEEEEVVVVVVVIQLLRYYFPLRPQTPEEDAHLGAGLRG